MVLEEGFVLRWRALFIDLARIVASTLVAAALLIVDRPVRADETSAFTNQATTWSTPASRAFETGRDAAGRRYIDCLSESKNSGFLGIGKTDPASGCAKDRAAYRAFLPDERADDLIWYLDLKMLGATEDKP